MRSLLAALLLPLVAAPLAAQATPPDSTAPDSLAARLRRMEESIALLREQLATVDEAGTRTASRARLELTGRVLMHGVMNSHRTNNADVPLFTRPDSGTLPARHLAATVRQTVLGARVGDMRALGARFDGDVMVDFFGGQQPSSGGRHFPLLRLRTARATLAWDRVELMAGQESPLVAELDPVSLASIGVPGFTAAGNLWLWLPQLRATVEAPGAIRLALQGALLSPTTGDPVGTFDTNADAAERSARPALQARLRARWGSEERAGELGVGVHQGWLATSGDSLLASRAVTATLLLPVTTWLELRGEAFDGQALRGLGGGGISQNLGSDGAPVGSRGGWAQLNLRRASSLVAGGGCGVDAIDARDRATVSRRRNTACEGHLIARPGGPIVLGAEYRRITTRYPAARLTNDHVSLAAGFEF